MPTTYRGIVGRSGKLCLEVDRAGPRKMRLSKRRPGAWARPGIQDHRLMQLRKGRHRNEGRNHGLSLLHPGWVKCKAILDT